jgi:hypothetical protein
MLYRCPGPHTFEGVACETTVVDAGEVDGKMAEGWHRNWMEASSAYDGLQDKLQANEAEQADIARKLDAAPKRGRRAA